MIAFIYNSGTGNRLGELTQNQPKALLKLPSGETILNRQLRLIKKSGINKVVISTGPFQKALIDHASSFVDLDITFVHNPKFSETNNIYSLFLARSILNEPCIILHGDLVFDQFLLEKMIQNPNSDIGLVNKSIPKPQKDFKGLLINQKISKISVDLFEENAFALQPMFKVSEDTLEDWLDVCENYINDGKLDYYAEDALNEVLINRPFEMLDYQNNYIEEIDTIEDFQRVGSEIRLRDFEDQPTTFSASPFDEIIKSIKRQTVRFPFLVHGNHLKTNLEFQSFSKNFNFSFSEYSPNPTLQEVKRGLKVFNESNCDGIVAFGGGSCLDVAKAIKWYSNNDFNLNGQRIVDSFINIPLIAIPTTAGTGSEATHFSVIYINDEKFSIAQDCLLPNENIISESFLINLPIYQRKSTLLDAFSQAFESYWAPSSNNHSKSYSKKSLDLILKFYQGYISGSNENLKEIMLSSHFAGKAINLTRTTAPHAMSYKLTKIFDIAHGHAVSITLPAVIEKTFKIATELRIEKVLEDLDELAEIFKCESKDKLTKFVYDFIIDFELDRPKSNLDLFVKLVESVNEERLSNHPVPMTKIDILEIYQASLN